VLDLGDWPESRTVSERLKVVRLILHITLEICEGREPPELAATLGAGCYCNFLRP